MAENEVLRLSTLTTLITAMKQAIANANATNDITEWSYTIDEEPAITGTDGTVGAYFTTAGLLQKLVEASGSWVEQGDPIITERYFQTSAIFEGILGVQTTALLFADDSQADGTLRRVTNDPVKSKNGVYSADSSEDDNWVKESDPVSLQDNVKLWTKTEGYFITGSIVKDNFGNISSASIEWPNGVTGVISNVTATYYGWTSARLTYTGSSKYATITITRDSQGSRLTTTITLTGF